MAQQPFRARVIGLPHIPAITEINVRSGPGTNFLLIFKSPVGTTDLPIIEVSSDSENREMSSKTYQWFRVQFPQGEGWVRDDLIEIWGDGTGTGYPVISTPTVAFNLTRQISSLPPGAEITGSGAGTATTEIVTDTSTATESSEVVTDSGGATESSEVVTTTVTVEAPSGPAKAMCMGKTGVNVRSGPGTNNGKVTRMNYKDSADVLDTAAAQDGNDFTWVKLRYQGSEGWVREDFLRLSGAFTAFGHNEPDKYPSPVPDTWWVRGWDPTGQLFNTGPHHGWDHGGNKGAPILAGPAGGVVYDVVFCQKCGAQGASTLERGVASLGDARVFRDPNWNFGYGHYIIVAYEHDKLPASTQQYLADNGKAGQHILVMYAHLQDMMVQKGQTLGAGQQIATLGNSGNSSGPHLHLEIRASDVLQPSRWSAIKGGLMTPGVLYLR